MKHQRREESEKRREEERRSEKRKSQNKEDAGREKVEIVVKQSVFSCLFHCFGAPAERKVVTKAAGAERSGEMRDE